MIDPTTLICGFPLCRDLQRSSYLTPINLESRVKSQVLEHSEEHERGRADNQFSSQEYIEREYARGYQTPNNESDIDDGYHRNRYLPQRGQCHHPRVMGAYQRKGFVLEEAMVGMINAQNAFLT
ncbi:hypothetical protein HAX54_022805 [Datura stramonium]|uniref:Uncharacterized protein n=1 Tax=Datura stramonium TaxID=4076 RepID=A0ABS8UUY1_DATST|nr:hypothetical protein [Datura stramonium]